MRHFIPLMLITLLPYALAAQDFSGIAYRIMDGDSLWVRTPQGREIEVRLAEIDAPERDQPYANAARDALNELVYGKKVEVRFSDTDNYGRIVARLYVGSVDVSTEMLRRGLAWVYLQYARDPSLAAVEDAARAARRGLWGAAESPIAPWEWRRNRRSASPSSAPAGALPQAFSCGAKRYCREMTSCAEAVFYLEQCGATTIDGDHDGIPCEAICR
jgi:endonuclease YncB( thermonuclease family)